MVLKSHISNEKSGYGHDLWNWEIKLLAEHNANTFVEAPPYIEKVQFKLHETFDNPVRLKTEPPFELSEKGWENLYEPYNYQYNLIHNDNSETIDTIVFMNPDKKLEELLFGPKDSISSVLIPQKGVKSTRINSPQPAEKKTEIAERGNDVAEKPKKSEIPLTKLSTSPDEEETKEVSNKTTKKITRKSIDTPEKDLKRKKPTDILKINESLDWDSVS
ncbi:hypothetical protein HK096_004383, partial [Nowakowskiella sp. JEL0078]